VAALCGPSNDGRAAAACEAVLAQHVPWLTLLRNADGRVVGIQL
jgi:hypothetical protein